MLYSLPRRTYVSVTVPPRIAYHTEALSLNHVAELRAALTDRLAQTARAEPGTTPNNERRSGAIEIDTQVCCRILGFQRATKTSSDFNFVSPIDTFLHGLHRAEPHNRTAQ